MTEEAKTVAAEEGTPHLWRNPISSTFSSSLSDSSDINDGETIQSDIRGDATSLGGVRKKERAEVINGGRGRR